jgi:hypothetical protein
MAIVSRRVLQRLLDENAKVLTEKQSREHVRILNAGGASALAVEYEVLILNGLSRLGSVEHEPHLSGPRVPDIRFAPAAAPLDVLVADVRTVSDVEAKTENPYEEFTREFGKLLNDIGLSAAGFKFEVQGALVGVAGKQKMKLSLPPKGPDLRRTVRRELRAFVKAVKNAPDRPAAISVPGFDVSIIYQPGQYGFSGHHPSFTVPFSIEKNPLMNALRDKADQLRGTGFPGLRGIFVCDGHCDVVRSPSTSGVASPNVSSGQIVKRFLRRSRSVGFVSLLTVPQPYPPFPAKSFRFHSELFLNPQGEHPCTSPQVTALRALPDVLPPAARTPANALHFLQSTESLPDSSYNSFCGGGQMADTEIRLSTRALVRVLAGRVSIAEFLRDHRMTDATGAIPFFENQLKAGRMLVAARVERVPDEDDDWMVLTFGESDSAIAPFRESVQRPTAPKGPRGPA